MAEAKPLPLLMMFLGVGITLVSAFIVATSGATYYKARQQQASWRPTEAEVLSYRVVSRSGRVAGNRASSKVYSTEFQVRYEVEGSTQISTLEIPYRTNDEAEMKRWADRYPVASKVAVKYDPANPAQLILADENAYAGQTKMLVFGAVGLALGLGLWITGLKLRAA